MNSTYGTIEMHRSATKNIQQNSKHLLLQNESGLSLFAATLFIAGEMAGSGVLALPRAVVNTGYMGIVLLLYFCFNSGYGGVRLGNCWNIVEERFHEHRRSARNPYAIIASKAVGKNGSCLVSHCIRITLFGAGTVYLLLSSQIVQSLLSDSFPNTSFCSYFLYIVAFVTPLMWFSSPKEFSIVGMGAILTTVIACILYFTQISVDAKKTDKIPVHQVHGFYDFFLSFGTILFSFGGASTFPTIQNDMKNKKEFTSCVIIAFTIILILYLPITLGGFFVYGEDVRTNVTLSLTKNVLVDIGNIFMACHLVFAFLIVMNTVCQDVEESLNIPRHFGWKRCLIRTLIVILVACVGETIPQFGKILSLIGGSTITLLTFVFPPYFYMKLCDQVGDWEKKHIPLHERVYIWQLIFIGIFGACAATFSAFQAIFDQNTFAVPCYLRR